MIHLSEHFGYKKLLRFTAPTMGMMVFLSVYGVIDGLFVSNLVSEKAFAAVNLMMPYLMLLSSVGFMVGTGGSALISKMLGEGKERKARETLTMLVSVSFVVGVIISAGGLLTIERLCDFVLQKDGGAVDAELKELCVVYSKCILVSIPFYLLENEFQSFFITAEHPHTGFMVTVAGGLTNIALDYILIAKVGMGIEGAGAATAMSSVVSGLFPLIFFARENGGKLRFAMFWKGIKRGGIEWRDLGKACANGSSEFVSSMAMSLTCILYNYQLMRLVGEDGVVAYGIIMYVGFILLAVFIGYANGCIPIIGYHYGAGNMREVRSVLRKSLIMVGCASAVIFAIGEGGAEVMAMAFVGESETLTNFTARAIRIYYVAYLFAGVNIFASAYFTGLGKGLISATISFSRTLVFEAVAVLTLPLWFGVDGVWMAVSVAEIVAIVMSCGFLGWMKKKSGKENL